MGREGKGREGVGESLLCDEVQCKDSRPFFFWFLPVGLCSPLALHACGVLSFPVFHGVIVCKPRSTILVKGELKSSISGDEI